MFGCLGAAGPGEDEAACRRRMKNRESGSRRGQVPGSGVGTRDGLLESGGCAGPELVVFETVALVRGGPGQDEVGGTGAPHDVGTHLVSEGWSQPGWETGVRNHDDALARLAAHSVPRDDIVEDSDERDARAIEAAELE